MAANSTLDTRLHRPIDPLVSTRDQSPEVLRQHLADQLRFLQDSAESFDKGFEGEASRLALAIRVLVHDTGRSTSLLGLLALKDSPFWDSAQEMDPHHHGSFAGLVMLAAGRTGRDYVAMLDQVAQARLVPIEEWWHRPVLVDDNRAALTRADCILSVADQDGGAHVDSSLDELYARLSRDNALGWWHVSGSNKRPLTNPVRPTVRQIAHEVLKTLVPGYTRRPQHRALAYFGGVTVTPVAPPAIAKPVVGRNAPCPCGSGKKYKKCHGATA